MNVEKFYAVRQEKVSTAISKKYPSISYSLIQKLFRNKDIKINGLRVNKDTVVDVGDEICFFVKDDVIKKIEIIYEDDNLAIVFKRRGIETVSEDSEDLLSLVAKQLNQQCFAVHRLDRNTEGLVIFAKNETAKKELDVAFKNRTIEKFYLTFVYGLFGKKQDNMIAYLKKDSAKSLVYISDKDQKGFEKIQTNYKVIHEFENASIVEVELVTGKTHQIRAHFSHIGHFVIGDEKYGDSNINKIFGKRYQCLCAYKIMFNFNGGELAYLNGKEIYLDKSKIDFCQNML